MRLDLGTETWNSHVPRTVKIVGEHGHHVDMGLETLRVQVLHVVILSGDNDTDSEAGAKSLAHLLDELHLVDPVSRSTTAALVAWPLPIDVNALEAPLRAELLEGVDEGFAILLGSGHVGPCVLCRARISELVAADADPLGDIVRQRHELFVDIIIVGIHRANLEGSRVDCGKGEHKMGDASEVQLARENFVAGTSSRVPIDHQS